VKSVYASRTQNKEKVILTLSSELAKATNEAAGELRGLVSNETRRREEIFNARVIEALQVGEAVDSRRMGPELSDLMHFCGPIQAVRALGPLPTLVQPGNNENLLHSAKDVLTKFERVIKEAAKSL
jgi:hypothetical protein